MCLTIKHKIPKTRVSGKYPGFGYSGLGVAGRTPTTVSKMAFEIGTGIKREGERERGSEEERERRSEEAKETGRGSGIRTCMCS